MTEQLLDTSVLERLEEQIGAPTVKQLLELFRANVRERLAAATEAFEGGQERELAAAFHSIRGSAQLVGARRLEGLSAHWESKAQSGEVEALVEALGEIAGCFEDVEQALEASGRLAGKSGRA